MKKITLIIAFLLFVGVPVFADGNAFTPLNFNDTSYSGSGDTVIKNTASSSTLPSSDEAIGNSNIQNAIQQLDNAQIDIRNELLNYRTKFADVDAQYKLVKTERANLKKQVKSIEKRIKEIDRAKDKIRKNML